MQGPSDIAPINQALSASPAVRANERATILRRVGRHHFAFFRGYLEGLDLRSLASRYLDSGGEASLDLREIKTTLRWIQDELVFAARWRGKFGWARVLTVDPARIPKLPAPAVPSLEEFREERDPDGFYSEEELIELFKDEFRDRIDRTSKRNARLRQRQIESLTWLEGIVAADPKLQDSVNAWLVDELAEPLRAAGIPTVAELISTINGRGQRWYVQIPRVGERAAGRILKWVEMSKRSLGIEIGPQVYKSRHDLVLDDLPSGGKKTSGMAPLERFRPPPELDGSRGENRGESNLSNANNDYDAIQYWLRSVTEPGSHTWRSYRKEAERFLLWAVLERHKPLSSCLVADCMEYRCFLRDLGRLSDKEWDQNHLIPQYEWWAKRGTPRLSELWRPFEQPTMRTARATAQERDGQQSLSSERLNVGVLSEGSQKLALVILKSMYEWLVRQGYLRTNPWDDIPAQEHKPIKAKADRSFTQAEWSLLMQELKNRPQDDPHTHRLRFVLLFLYSTGLRLSELCRAVRKDLEATHSGWQLKLTGKGKKEWQVPIPSTLMEELVRYLVHRGYATLDEVPPGTPLVGRIVGFDSPVFFKGRKRTEALDLSQVLVATSTIYRTLKLFFTDAAITLEQQSKTDAERFAKASTHWLRRTHSHHAAATRVNLAAIQAGLDPESMVSAPIDNSANCDGPNPPAKECIRSSDAELGN